MKVLCVAGARPNWVKIAQFHSEAEKHGIEYRWVHTGQHHDEALSGSFLRDLGIPYPDFSLVCPGTPAARMGSMISGIGGVIESWRPDWTLVVGDVDSTLAGCLAAKACGVQVAHVEAGLRCWDRRMPEERNRVLVDYQSDLHFVTEIAGMRQLAREGFKTTMHLVGNTMIDTLVKFQDRIEDSDITERLELDAGSYALLTLHRPASVDTKEGWETVLPLVTIASSLVRCIFPVHPRTRARIQELGIQLPGVTMIDPLGYFDFQKLMSRALVVLTDSGGVQEETTYYRVKCITLRPSTERPSTLAGTNVLMAHVRPDYIFDLLTEKDTYRGVLPEFWDGHATERIFNILGGLND